MFSGVYKEKTDNFTPFLNRKNIDNKYMVNKSKDVQARKAYKETEV